MFNDYSYIVLDDKKIIFCERDNRKTTVKYSTNQEVIDVWNTYADECSDIIFTVYCDKKYYLINTTAVKSAMSTLRYAIISFSPIYKLILKCESSAKAQSVKSALDFILTGHAGYLNKPLVYNVRENTVSSLRYKTFSNLNTAIEESETVAGLTEPIFRVYNGNYPAFTEIENSPLILLESGVVFENCEIINCNIKNNNNLYRYSENWGVYVPTGIFYTNNIEYITRIDLTLTVYYSTGVSRSYEFYDIKNLATVLDILMDLMWKKTATISNYSNGVTTTYFINVDLVNEYYIDSGELKFILSSLYELSIPISHETHRYNNYKYVDYIYKNWHIEETLTGKTRYYVNPIYDDTNSHYCSDILVAIANAISGSVIILEDTVHIDYTLSTNVIIKDGVDIYVPEGVTLPVFRYQGNGISQQKQYANIWGFGDIKNFQYTANSTDIDFFIGFRYNYNYDQHSESIHAYGGSELTTNLWVKGYYFAGGMGGDGYVGIVDYDCRYTDSLTIQIYYPENQGATYFYHRNGYAVGQYYMDEPSESSWNLYSVKIKYHLNHPLFERLSDVYRTPPINLYHTIIDVDELINYPAGDIYDNTIVTVYGNNYFTTLKSTVNINRTDYGSYIVDRNLNI